MHMLKNYSGKNLQQISFKDEDLSHADFSGSDLRGADFTGSDLSGANFAHAKTGITPANKVILFFIALVISFGSGFIAMLTGYTIREMLLSNQERIRMAGLVSMGLILFFIVYSYLKGVGSAIRNLVIPVVIIASLIGISNYVLGTGTRYAMLYIILSLVLTAVMFIVGVAARAAAGTLSSTILFLAVAMGGAWFGKNLGGGAGTVLMALSCALISKRGLSGAKGFEVLRKVAASITRKFGTSFRNARLSAADFSATGKLINCDFTNADMSEANWGDSIKVNCLAGREIITEKRGSRKHRSQHYKNILP